jgi:hypothetical protein
MQGEVFVWSFIALHNYNLRSLTGVGIDTAA